MPASIHTIKSLCKGFLSIKCIDDLVNVLETDTKSLSLALQGHRYKVYKIPKTNGEVRLIEDPLKSLKTIVRSLNEYLQAV